MRYTALRPAVVALGLLWLLFGALTAMAATESGLEEDRPAASTIPPVAPVLHNGEFECSTGYYSTTNAAGKVIYVPNFWQLHLLAGAPKTQSTLLNFTHNCADAGLEHIGGSTAFWSKRATWKLHPNPANRLMWPSHNRSAPPWAAPIA